jgi:class 3 adenylate cyclase/tetratricopeptide (TPR) repeat protein
VDGRLNRPVLREAQIDGGRSASSHDLASYVSRLLAGRLATAGPIERFEATTLRAALLLTDIAGFTAYVEQVSSSGRAGLEDLARAFDGYFSDLVGIVYGHGGDVLAIAGDAFFSYWPVDDDVELGDAVMRASEAALAIQAGLGERQGVGGHDFQTRAGVGAGRLTIAFVGGIGDRWELMPVGTPIADVARAERHARPGTVAVAEPAWLLVADRCAGRPLDDGLYELTEVRRPVGPMPAASLLAPDPSDDLIAGFVPLPVRRRQTTAGTEWMQEMRRVTVVMASLGMAGNADRGVELSHLGVQAFQRVMARFEGAAKVLVDNKGVTLSGAFGLPPRAHADDARRAITAAETLRRELGEIGLSCTIGVATGRAFCGVFGSDLRREYTLHGEVVNLASRLMEASGGEILCCDLTAQATHGSVGFEALAPVTLKGRAEPVAVHRASWTRNADAPRESRMVGREAEQAAMSARIDDLVTEDRSATMVIQGGAGLGKSRLVGEAIRLARGRGVRVLTAAADAVESATSYYAWRSMFSDLLEVTPQTMVDPHSLEVPCDPQLRRMRPLLSSIVPVGIPDNELTATMDGAVRAENTKLLLASILRQTTAATPALVVVEDAHWLDSNSWALLLEIVQSVPRALVVVTMRPMDDPPEQYTRLRALGSTEILTLGPLSAAEIQTLVKHRLGVSALAPELTGFVDDRVAGHPFFCEQLVQTMREGGLVRVEDGTAVVGDLDTLDIPATIEGAVLSRIDRLTAGQLLCLKVAAVIGRSFLSRTVTDTLPARDEREAVPQHLETLARLELTMREAEHSELAYLFRHEITREVAYDLLTVRQSRQLHRAVAEWHERTYSDDELAPHYALLAHHWARAHDPDKTVTYLARAGQQALRSGAFREALLFLSDALAVDGATPDPVRDAMCQKGLGTAYYFVGDFGRSRACLELALAQLATAFPSTRLDIARGLAREAAVQAAHLIRPARYLGRRRAATERISEALGCYKILGQIGYLEGDPTPVLLYGTFAGLNLGEEGGPSPDLARMLIHAATASSIVGLQTMADRYAERAIAMVDAGAQREASAYVWNVWAVIHAHRGDWARAEKANATALERLGEVGDFNLEAEVWQMRSAIYLGSGAFGSAESAWSRHRALADRKRNPQNLCWSLLDEAETRVGRDETDAAAAALDAALAIPTAPNDGSSTIEKHYATAVVRAAQRRWPEAIRSADAIIDMLERRPPSAFHYVDFCAGAVGVYFDALEADGGDRAGLLRRAQRGCKVVRRAARQFGSVRARRWLLEGLLAWAQGEHPQARERWRRAEAIALRKGTRFELARARYEIARHSDPAAAERRAYLADAATTFERLGALQMLRRVREAQAQDQTAEVNG